MRLVVATFRYPADPGWSAGQCVSVVSASMLILRGLSAPSCCYFQVSC